jgi:hypothetical protein
MSGESIHMASPSSETSTTGASPVVARCRSPAAMPPAMAMPPARSPKPGRPPMGNSAVARLEGVGHRAPGPIGWRRRSRPSRGRVRAGPGRCPGRRRCWGSPPDVLDVDLQALAHGGQEAGEEHVGGLGELVEEVPAPVGADVDPDAALAPVGLLDDVVDGAGPPGIRPIETGRAGGRRSPGCSTLITSAPQSARTAPAAGTKVHAATSSTRKPESALAMVSSFGRAIGRGGRSRTVTCRPGMAAGSVRRGRDWRGGRPTGSPASRCCPGSSTGWTRRARRPGRAGRRPCSSPCPRGW